MPAVSRYHAMLLIAGALLAAGGIAWGAKARPRPVATIVPVAARPAATHVSATPVATVHATPRKASVRPAAETLVGEAGMRIYRTDDGLIETQPSDMLNSVGAGVVPVSNLKQERMPNGAVKIDLKGNFEESMIIQIDSKGHRVERCVPDPSAALRETPIAAPAQPAQREDR